MLFDVLSVRRARAHYVVVLDETDHILQNRHEIRDADDLETFRERFRRLCWLDGPNRSIIMLYLKIFDVR